MQLLSSPTHLAVMETDRGADIGRRVDALGITDREFHAKTGIDRKTLRRAIAGEASVRGSTYGAIEAALDKLERSVQPARQIVPNEQGLVTFRLTGNFGVDVTVQGPVSDLDALEASVEKLLRGMRTSDE
jgi:hypothetical protein